MNPQLSATTFKCIRNLLYGFERLSIRNYPQPLPAESTTATVIACEGPNP